MPRFLFYKIFTAVFQLPAKAKKMPPPGRAAAFGPYFYLHRIVHPPVTYPAAAKLKSAQEASIETARAVEPPLPAAIQKWRRTNVANRLIIAATP